MRNRETIREYVTGSLWVLPGFSAVLALVVGFILSRIRIDPESPLAFQGTADDARTLLSNVTGTVVTVIALVLGLTVVALQLSSTQFSPTVAAELPAGSAEPGRAQHLRRDLRLFRGRPVHGRAVRRGARRGLPPAGGQRGDRCCCSPAWPWWCTSRITSRTPSRSTPSADGSSGTPWPWSTGGWAPSRTPTSTPPAWAVPLLAPMSGYVQTAHPELLLPLAAGTACTFGSACGSANTSSRARCWRWIVDRGPGRPGPRPGHLPAGPARAVRIGFERTQRTGRRARHPATRRHGLQGVVTGGERPLHRGPGDRPPVGDLLRARGAPARRRRGRGPDRPGVVIVPGRRFGDYLATMCGLIRRYGCAEPTVSLALLRLLHECAAVLPDDPARWAAIGEQADLVLADATRETAQPADLAPVVAAAADLQRRVARHLPGQPAKSSTQRSATSR